MEHCTIDIPIQDENHPPDNRASTIHGLWKMTSKLGQKRLSQEPVSPMSLPPEAKRLCEDSSGRSVFGRIGKVLWTAGGSVANAAGALGSLATFRSRRGASDIEIQPEQSAFASEAEASDAVVLDVGVTLEHKEARIDEAAVDTAAVPEPEMHQVAQKNVFPEAVRGADIEIEYQQLLEEIAQEPMPEAFAVAADEASYDAAVATEPCNQGSNWEALTGTGIACENHVEAMMQVAGELQDALGQNVPEEPQGDEAMGWAQAPSPDNDHACLISIDPAPGNPRCESGQYCQGTATDEVFEDGGDRGHYYCGPCFEAAGVV